MPISSGTATVGLGGTYLTWATALADLAVTLTGNVTFTQIAPTVETVTAKPPSGFDWNGWILTCQSDSYRHTGLGINNGRLIDFNHSDHGFDFTDIAAGTDPALIMEWLYTTRSVASPGKYDILLDTDVGTWGFAQKTFRYLLMDGGSSNGDTGIRIQGAANGAFDIHHCIFHEYNLRCMVLAMNSSARLEHCSWVGDGSAFDGFGSSGGEVINCYGSTSGAAFLNTVNLNGTNNASADLSAGDGFWSTGIGNITSLSTFTAFHSITFTSPDFLRPFFNSPVTDGGSSAVTINPPRDLLEHKYPRTKTFVAPPSVQVIYTIGAQQLGVVDTDLVETNDSMPLFGTLFEVDGADVLELSEDDVSLKLRLNSGSDVLELSEQADVVATYVVSGEDTLELLDAGINIPLFECIPDQIPLRGRTNFWFPTDTMLNELTLSQPLPDDQYNLATRVVTRHSKGGDLRVYKRGKVLHSLSMNFVVERPHRDLALAFFEISSSQEVRLLDWEGRLWHGVVTNTPITFNAEGKSSSTEKFSFSVEFEGIRQ